MIKTGCVVSKKESPYSFLKFSLSSSEISQYTNKVVGVCAKIFTIVWLYLYGKS